MKVYRCCAVAVGLLAAAEIDVANVFWYDLCGRVDCFGSWFGESGRGCLGCPHVMMVANLRWQVTTSPGFGLWTGMRCWRLEIILYN